nr:MAG TPA_asm: hypothetical protein [Caudoviricetes sp.]
MYLILALPQIPNSEGSYSTPNDSPHFLQVMVNGMLLGISMGEPQLGQTTISIRTPLRRKNNRQEEYSTAVRHCKT